MVLVFPDLPETSVDVADIATADVLIRLTNVLNDLPARRERHVAGFPDLHRNIANARRQLEKDSSPMAPAWPPWRSGPNA